MVRLKHFKSIMLLPPCVGNSESVSWGCSSILWFSPNWWRHQICGWNVSSVLTLLSHHVIPRLKANFHCWVFPLFLEHNMSSVARYRSYSSITNWIYLQLSNSLYLLTELALMKWKARTTADCSLNTLPCPTPSSITNTTLNSYRSQRWINQTLDKVYRHFIDIFP